MRVGPPGKLLLQRSVITVSESEMRKRTELAGDTHRHRDGKAARKQAFNVKQFLGPSMQNESFCYLSRSIFNVAARYIPSL